jgi:hypothetical protein
LRFLLETGVKTAKNTTRKRVNILLKGHLFVRFILV